jgi:phosphate starvation-inducible PhoH-like protein
MGKKYVYKDRSIVKADSLFVKSDFPWTPSQEAFNELASKKSTKIMFVNGPAGVSKTFLAVYQCLKLLQEGKIDSIIYVRSIVESSSHSLGFLKGDQDEKFAPYMMPLEDKLHEFLNKSGLEFIKKNGLVEAAPFNFLRGAHFTNKGIIVDESQNATFSELITLLTRIGDFNKVFICGDERQSDVGKLKTGFKPILELFSDSDSKKFGIESFEFTSDDIVRSELVKFIVKKLESM